MSATQTRLPRAEATALAWELLGLLSPVCERIEIAGSIRRQRESIGDIELVAVPVVEAIEERDLFGPVRRAEIDRLHVRCVELIADGCLAHRLDKNGRPAFGSKHKRLIYRDFGLDLFVVSPPAQWGVIQMLRTGSAEFNKRLVVPEERGGWMPKHMYIADGALRQWSAAEVKVLETPTEESVFAAIGRPYIPPELREV